MEIPFSRNKPASRILSDEEIALRVISRFSRGNVRMQKQSILTREKLDARARRRAVQIARLKKIYGINSET